MFQFKMPCYVIAGGLFLVAASCAPSATNRPNVAAPSNEGAGPSAAANRPAAEGSGATKESNTPTSSSLDQLREGKSSATAATSPLKDVCSITTVPTCVAMPEMFYALTPIG
jgi:hypothetical protein